MKALLTCLLLLVIGMANSARGEESAEWFEETISKKVSARYLLVKPKDYDAHERYPLLIFLHGRGEQGDDLARVKIHGPFKKVAELQLPLLIVAPQSPRDEHWDIDMLAALAEEVIDDLDVDEDRVYLIPRNGIDGRSVLNDDRSGETESSDILEDREGAGESGFPISYNVRGGSEEASPTSFELERSEPSVKLV